MALPANVDWGSVTGKLLDSAGNAVTGTVTFKPSPASLKNITADPPVTILPKPVTVTIGVDGVIPTTSLVATDDADNNPVGWTYAVTFELVSASLAGFSISVPAGETVDLTTVAPVASANGAAIVRGPGVPDPDGVTDGWGLVVDAASDGGTKWAAPASGSGAVDSVNGQTGTVVLDAADVSAAPALVAVNAQTGSYTLALSDAACAVEVTSSSAADVTIPLNSSVAFPVGTLIEVVQMGTGQVSIVKPSGVTLNSRGSLVDLAGQYAVCSLRKQGTDEWLLTGDLT